jgi:hypothetical protein
MSTATLPDGTITTNFAVMYDSLDTNGPGVLKWNGAYGPRGTTIYAVRFTSASQEASPAGDAWRFDFDGAVSIQGYDDGAPLPSLLPENAHHWV